MMTRRDMLRSATTAGYALAADTVLAQAITTDTTGILAGDFQVPVAGHALPVYEARPAAGRGHPVVLVISEVFGLHEYIRDVTRRLAKEGFHAVAPELFAREGGVRHLAKIEDVLAIVLAAPRDRVLGDIAAAGAWARTRPGARGDRMGVTGWCWGGSTAIQVAATNPDVRAVVVWYGPPGRPYATPAGPVTGFDVAPRITVPFLGLFGETDQSPSPGDARRLGEMLSMHNDHVEIMVYPGAGHGFHADYRRGYNAAAAADGWKRCVAWLNKYLRD